MVARNLWDRGNSQQRSMAQCDFRIFHIRKAEISVALKDSSYRVKGEHFGRRDGLPGIAPQLRPLQTAIEGAEVGTRGPVIECLEISNDKSASVYKCSPPGRKTGYTFR